MKRLSQLTRLLRPGRVYRTADLAEWSNSVDRHVRELVDTGVLQKLQAGLYYYPEESAFGQVPPRDREVVRAFLKGDDFLLTSPNAFNSLGLGTTQLYNTCVVYNHKRHGRISLAGQVFEFRRKPGFPKELSKEFLLVELLNSLPKLEENTTALSERACAMALKLDSSKLAKLARSHGKVSTRKLLTKQLGDAA